MVGSFNVVREVELFFGLLATLSVLAILARRVQIPLPIFLVSAGILAGFVPGLPEIALHPDLVLFLFLPPLVFGAATVLSWRDFRTNLRAITLLATGGVVFTAVLVAYIVRALVPAIPLAAAFVLGASVSPPDPVAATSIATRLGIPRRLITVLEGEGIVNDATALILYRFAVAAVVVGTFSLPRALSAFVIIIAGEIAWGIAVGRFFSWLLPKVNEPAIDIALSLTAPYISYLIPHDLGGSGVLAAVTAGMVLGEQAFSALAYETRIQAVPVWRTIRFVLENLLFLVTGLQFKSILAGIEEYSWASLSKYAAVVSITVIVARFVWVYPSAYLSRALTRSLGGSNPYPSWEDLFLVAFTGMRGAVSLAAALAVPVMIQSGQAFPGRHLIAFLTFCVIISTLLLQGISLPYVICGLGLDRKGKKEDEELERQEIEARLAMTEAALSGIDQFRKEFPDATVDPVQHSYARRRRLLRRTLHGKEDDTFENEINLRRDLLEVERQKISAIRQDGKVSDEVLRRLEHDLDLEQSQLETRLREDEND